MMKLFLKKFKQKKCLRGGDPKDVIPNNGSLPFEHVFSSSING